MERGALDVSLTTFVTVQFIHKDFAFVKFLRSVRSSGKVLSYRKAEISVENCCYSIGLFFADQT